MVVGAYIDPNSDVRIWVNFIFSSRKRPLNVDMDVDANVDMDVDASKWDLCVPQQTCICKNMQLKT